PVGGFVVSGADPAVGLKRRDGAWGRGLRTEERLRLVAAGSFVDQLGSITTEQRLEGGIVRGRRRLLLGGRLRLLWFRFSVRVFVKRPENDVILVGFFRLPERGGVGPLFAGRFGNGGTGFEGRLVVPAGAPVHGHITGGPGKP